MDPAEDVKMLKMKGNYDLIHHNVPKDLSHTSWPAVFMMRGYGNNCSLIHRQRRVECCNPLEGSHNVLRTGSV